MKPGKRRIRNQDEAGISNLHRGSDPAAPYVLNPQESFEFRCPASPRNRRALIDIYNESFADLPFDGIFLDRIRYSSFLSGVAGIGGCFCPECVKRYEAAGISVDQLRQRLALLEAGEPLPLAAYAGGPKGGFEELVRRELTWLGQERGCSVWPGIEANYIEPIALIGPEQIRQNLRLLQSLGYEQIVVSWNLNRIPPENMEALLDPNL